MNSPIMVPVLGPATSYNSFTMDKIQSPLLSSSELDEAIIKITDALNSLGVSNGIIGSAAISLYARHYGFPHRPTSNISIVIQPTNQASAAEISARFSEKRFADNFVCWMVNGIRVPKVIITRTERYGEKKIAVSFKLLDHYMFPERRLYYDFSLDPSGSRRILWAINRKRFKLLNAPWLLRQKILAWGERMDAEKRRIDVVDIKTICDIMERQNQRLQIRDREEVKVLRTFVRNVHEDPTSFRISIDCPEVLGPLWEIRWVKVLLFIFGVLALGLFLDRIYSTNDWKLEVDPLSFGELWQEL
ncbi:uncharacterized protein LY89DRAFT_375904 [Mollisia scopiformis]|uniref:Uncharacterized protein n=1 Tax=Mollisia scopiformis TaxID=149040 RepID=A0A132B3T7_MOLSC|nr:uncharacterized protein LY89DRAFT_375904 [Mollisia scopiformis]KUJ07046.1 hypothetical protein LY89DRAFT_375904 [Mollisia scopiformis]